ncbi:CBS domain-containing membrane protein [Desulfonatronum thiosulfatophilum]|uniref:CBS domain-containing membrane protein n=1 Tax=Desulfonatronum thiosulfatophilum TaxID=617002 RepID=A0A1G6DPH3_9BACT|nr:CBS domain-containing protein [Desulfonatronum thiosulfatophilum]SDB47012.1 CBS domain-containing membrane protein [Desulfonatronum thiosulfatophilum]
MLKVKDLMTKQVISLQEHDNVQTARSIMNLGRIRHIPIVDKQGDFAGLLTHRDLLAVTISKLADIEAEVQDEIDASIPIHEIMRRDVTAIDPEMDLREAAEILLQHKYGCLPVVEDKMLVGILTEADFLKLTISLMDALDKMEA